MSHKQIGDVIKHSAEISCAALSPSGEYLACGVGRIITIHNLRGIVSPEYLCLRHPCIAQLPLVQVSDNALKSWTQDDPTNTEILLSEEIASTSSPSHYILVNRALIRTRLRHFTLAVEDAKESLQVQPSPIGYIVMAAALLGQGNWERALCTFDFAFHDCESHDTKFLLLLKSILVFESGIQEEAIACVEHLVTRANNDNNNDTTYIYTRARALRDAVSLLIISTGSWGYVHEEGKLWTCDTIDRACEEPSHNGRTVSCPRNDFSHIWMEFQWTGHCCSATSM